MRGPQWRGFSADSEKSLFRLPGGTTSPTRLVVVEAPIDALSLAALEGPWVDTLYLATAGGMGPATVAALEALLAERAGNPDARLVAATDADLAGDRHAGFLAELAKAAGVILGAAPPTARPQGLERPAGASRGEGRGAGGHDGSADAVSGIGGALRTKSRTQGW